MKASSVTGRIGRGMALTALVALLSPLASLAAKTHPPPKGAPRATTGAALHVLPTSALLSASIDPKGKETSYFFQYGATTGSSPATPFTNQTPVKSAGSGLVKVLVGEPISGLTPGTIYHFRIVASNAANLPGESIVGKERIFVTKGGKARFVITKPPAAVYGSPYVLSGTLAGGANRRIAIQASPNGSVEPFSQIGPAGTTNASGRFSFRITNLTSATQFRVVTLDALPLYSPIVTVQVALRVTFSIRPNKATGLVRLYGTVSPAVGRTKVYLQVEKAVRSNTGESTTRYVNQFITTTKHGGASFSRFSIVVKVRRSGRYRAYVRYNTNGLVSGTSTRTYVLHKH